MGNGHARHSAGAPEPAITTLPEDRRLVVIQRNPTSGSGRGRKQLWNLLNSLRAAGLDARIYQNRERFSSFVNNPRNSQNIRCLVAAGGDGTISSLVQRHPDFPIATLPLGTENLVARHLGILCDGRRLGEIIAAGQLLSFDTGMVGNHRFLLMASVGLDAEVVHRLAQSRSGNISHLSYLKPLLASFRNYSYAELNVLDANGKSLATGSHVLVSNMPEYGMKIPFSPAANPHDGLLDVRVFRHRGILRTGRHLIRTRLGGKDRSSEVLRFQAEAVTVKSSVPEVPLQADGDPCTERDLCFRLAEEKMLLVVPPRFRPRQN